MSSDIRKLMFAEFQAGGDIRSASDPVVRLTEEDTDCPAKIVADKIVGAGLAIASPDQALDIELHGKQRRNANCHRQRHQTVDAAA